MTDFRCAVASEDADEPLPGTAPTDVEWLFVEDPGPWGRKAVRDSRLPEEVVTHLSAMKARVQLIRRHGGGAATGTRVFTASMTGGATGRPLVRTALLDDLRDVPALRDSDLTAYDDPLWLVCTNGRRDLCCAERGRPIAAALAGRWPESTWETTHLGGHRFAGTLLALPSGLVLGRLDARSAVTACAEILDGRVPSDLTRGRAGWLPAAQAADLNLRGRHGWAAHGDVRLVAVEGDTVILETPDGPAAVETRRRKGESRLQSCGDDTPKAPSVVEIVEIVG